MQKLFSAIEFGFQWTKDGWYTFDREAAQKKALAARNKLARELRDQGKTVTTFSLPKQTRTMGGIGSGKPQIELVVNSYGLNASE